MARGGSKGILKKNLIDFCGKPLIYWTISQCLESDSFVNVWVSSDDDEILDLSISYGANVIKRPKKYSNDNSSSEDAWTHASKTIIKNNYSIDSIFSPQITSPIREIKDIKKAVKLYKTNLYDSIFSSNLANDINFWSFKKNKFTSINYDYKKRTIRQKKLNQYIENGSFYLFDIKNLIKYKNRFGKKIGFVEMEFWKMFEIDEIDDLRFCSMIMREYLLKKKKLLLKN